MGPERSEDVSSRIGEHRSARLGYGAATKLLVDRGSVITTEDNDGRTARDLAEGSDRAIKGLTKQAGSLMEVRCVTCIHYIIPRYTISQKLLKPRRRKDNPYLQSGRLSQVHFKLVNT
jgi:hypothetical protein